MLKVTFLNSDEARIPKTSFKYGALWWALWFILPSRQMWIPNFVYVPGVDVKFVQTYTLSKVQVSANLISTLGKSTLVI